MTTKRRLLAGIRGKRGYDVQTTGGLLSVKRCGTSNGVRRLGGMELVGWQAGR